MGGSQSVFTEQELNDYQELTYFTKKEILHVYRRFSNLDPDAVANDKKNAKIAKAKILELPELKVNPFRVRICQVFSSSKDGDLTFEDFLDMMSVFSDNAPKAVKADYAFRIYDFDDDDQISSADLEQVIKTLIGEGNTLEDTQMKQMIESIFKEADLDNDNALSYPEFEHVISKAPDFVDSFRIRL